jgi:F-type H+-transporting ATPase subunit beta
MEKYNGKVLQVLGGVVDVQFPPDNIPDLFEALEINNDDGTKIILEVQKQLANSAVRCISWHQRMDFKEAFMPFVRIILSKFQLD